MSRPMPRLSDEELIPGLRAADEATVQVLIDRYWERAYRVALHQVTDPGAAEDVAQQTFIEILRAADRFDTQRRFRPWFFRVLAHTAADHRRARGRRRKHEDAAAHAERESDDASVHAARGETAALLRAEVQALDAPLREVITLRYLEGLSLAETAEALEVPQGTVSSRARRGLEALRQRPALAGATVSVATLVAALGEATRDLPSAPSAAEVVASTGGVPVAAPPPPAATEVVAKAGAARRLAPALGAIAVIGLAAVSVGALVRSGSGRIASTPPPSGAARTPSAAPPGGSASLTDAGAEEAVDPVAALPALNAPLVASVSSADQLSGVWLASLDPEQVEALKSVPRDNDAAASVGRLYAGYTVPGGAVALTRADGKIPLTLPPGEHVVAVGARGAPTQIHKLSVPASGQLELPVSFAPVEPATLVLDMRDAKGRPFRTSELTLLVIAGDEVAPLIERRDEVLATPEDANAQVLLEELIKLRDGIQKMMRFDPIVSDADGLLHLVLAPGSYELRGSVRCGRYNFDFDVPERGVKLNLESGATQTLRLTSLPPTYPHVDVAVRVVDRSGRPVPGARYEILQGSYLDYGYEKPVQELLRARESSRVSLTGSDGTRLVRGVHLGSAAVVARHEYQGGRSPILQLERDGELQEVTVALDETLDAAPVEFTILGPEGQPLEGEFALDVVWKEAGGMSTGRRLTTNAEGIALAEDLLAGRCTFRAWGGGYAPSVLREVELRGGELQRVELQLTPGATLSGWVNVAGGRASEGRLNLIVEGKGSDFGMTQKLKADGSFAFTGLPPGPYEIRVSSVPGQTEQPFAGLQPGTGLELALAAEPVWEVTVVDDAGQPLEGAQVEVRGYRSDGRNPTDAAGKAVIRGPLNEGWVSLSVEGGGKQRDKLEPYHERFESMPQGFSRRVVLSPPKPQPKASLHGVVVNSDGTPVAGVNVAVRYRGPTHGPSENGGRSDAEGRFEFPTRAPGRVTLLAELGRWQGKATTRVVDGGRHELKIKLWEGVLVSGQVRGTLRGRRFNVEGTRLATGKVDAVTELWRHGGKDQAPFVLGYLRPGRWQLNLYDLESGTKLHTVEVELTLGSDVTDLVLEAGAPR